MRQENNDFRTLSEKYGSVSEGIHPLFNRRKVRLITPDFSQIELKVMADIAKKERERNESGE